jgi:hypothetical protein
MVTLEEYRIEKEWFWTAVDVKLGLSFTTDDEFAAITWVRMKSCSSLASEEADDFLREVARLLNRIEGEGRRTGELTK